MLPRATSLTPQELNTAIVRSPLVVSPQTNVMTAIVQMSGLRSLCNTTVNPDSQIETLHQEARSSCVIVVAQGQVVGILTERDVVRLLTQQQPLDSLEIGQVMAAPVVTLRESALTDLFFVLELFNHHQIRHLPIVDSQEHPVGLVTYETLRQICRPIDLLRWRQVREVMTHEVICAAPESSILEIAKLMADHSVSCVVIVQPGVSEIAAAPVAVGMITERDLVQFQALGLNHQSYKAFAVMSTPIFAVTPEESLDTVRQLMEQRLIRRLVVTGNQGELLGIVTQSSLLQALNPLEICKVAEVLEQKVRLLEADKVALLSHRNRELEQQVAARTADLQAQAERQKLVAQIANSIRTSLNLQEVLDIGVAEVRGFLQCDRVLVYQLKPDGSGMMIAESVAAGWLQALGEQIKDACFGELLTRLYDCEHPIAVNNIYTRGYSDCHLRLLEQYQVKALLVMPIRVREQLWGLLLGHQCTATREWQTEDLNLLQEISVQLAIAIQQATTHQQLQQELIARQLTETRLRESEQRYATLAATVPVGIFRTDRAGNCIYINQRGCEIVGQTPEAPIGEGWKQGLHPDDREQVAAKWQQLLQDKHPFELEYRLQHPDGTVKWVYGQAVAERDADGQAIGYVGTITDISERKASEQALQLQKDFNQLIAEITSRFVDVKSENLDPEIERSLQLIGEFIQADTSCIVTFDRGADTMTMSHEWIKPGCPPKIAIVQNIPFTACPWSISLLRQRHICYVPDTTNTPPEAAIDAVTWQHFNLKSFVSIPLVQKSAVVGLIGFGCFSRPMSWKEETIRLLAFMAQTIANVQERTQADQQLRLLSNRLQEAQRIALLGNWELEFLKHSLYWSDQVFRIFEIDPQEFEGSYDGFLKLVYPDDRKMVNEAYTHHLRHRTPYKIVHRLQMSDGRIKYIQQQCETLYALDGSPIVSHGTIQDITSLKQTELELELLNAELEKRVKERTSQLLEREAQVQDLFDGANDLIHSVRLENGRFAYVNRAWRETLGYSESEVASLTVFDILHPDYHDRYLKLIPQLRDGTVAGRDRLQVIFLTKDKREIVVEGSINVRLENARPVATRAIFRDVTQRHQYEAQLQTLSERLQLAVRSARMGIWDWDIVRDRVTWDDRMFELYGLKSSDFKGTLQVWQECLHPDDTTYANELLQKAIQGEQEFDAQFRILHPDGSMRWLQAHAIVQRNSQGEAQRMIGVNIDITDYQQIHQQRQQLIHELFAFKHALDQSAIVAITDAKGAIVYANDLFCEISGYCQDEIIGQTHRIVNSGYHPPSFFQDLWRTIIRGKIWRGEICNRAKNGSLYWVASTIIPFLDQQGLPFQYLTIRFDITARKIAEATLLQENTFRQQIVENMAEGLCVFHQVETFPFVRFTVWNQQMQAITGYTLEEINRLGWYQSLYPDPEIQAQAIARMGRMRYGENPIAEEWEIQRQDGQKRTIAVSTSVLASKDGLTYVLALIQDITARKQTEQAMKQQLAAIEAAIDGIAILQGDTYLYVNQAHLELFGYQNSADLLGKSWSVLYSPEEIERFEQEVLPVLGRDRAWQGEAMAIRKDGSSFYQEVSLTLAEDGLLISVCRDITDRKQAEQTIRNQAEREALVREITQRIRQSLDLQTIFATATQEIRRFLQADRVAIFKFYPESGFNDGEIVSESVAAEFMPVLGIRIQDNCFGKWFDPLDQQGQIQATNDIQNADLEDCHKVVLSRFQVQANLSLPLLKGEKLWGLLCIHQCSGPRHWQATEINFTQQIANQLAIAIQQASLFEQLQQELSERQLAQQLISKRNQQLAISNQELARATRLKDEFLANMSHELRTPLNAILGMTEGLQEEVFGNVNSRQIKALETIERSGQHLLELINDILDLAKIESGQIDLDCQPIDVAQLCQSSLAFIKQLALKKRITLEIKLPLNLPNLLIDQRRIRQVLINLLNNAVKFTPEGGFITLEATLQQSTANPQPADSPSQHCLQISVRDTGIGIAQEHIDRLFQPFVQIDSALNRQYSGTGLGLSLVKRIVELHGGQVGVTSREGIGSCFTVNLPCVALSPSAPKPETPPEATSAPSSICTPAPEASPLILLAEDNEANISTLSSYLKAKGYRLRLAKNGLEAIAMAQSQPPDLIVMDIQMPQMDGLDAIQQIRRHRNLVDVPIIALTALAMPGDRERCLDAGANDYLTKPVKLKQLVTIIQQLLSPFPIRTF